MKTAAIYVSKGKSTVAVLRAFGEVVDLLIMTAMTARLETTC